MSRKYFFPAIDCILWRIHYFIFLLAVWLLLPCITVDERLLISQDLGRGALSSSRFGVHHPAIMDGRLDWLVCQGWPGFVARDLRSLVDARFGGTRLYMHYERILNLALLVTYHCIEPVE
jgi:hypothetical protein